MEYFSLFKLEDQKSRARRAEAATIVQRGVDASTIHNLKGQRDEARRELKAIIVANRNRLATIKASHRAQLDEVKRNAEATREWLQELEAQLLGLVAALT